MVHQPLVSLPAVSVLQTVLVSAGQCDLVFKGFSECLLKLGENMANYPQDMDDRENLHTICTYVQHTAARFFDFSVSLSQFVF